MITRSRLAPTPSGFLHYGNLLNFVLTWVEVRRRQGVLVLRVDDLDAIRARDEYVEDIFATLNALGIDWDEGPRNAEEFRTAYSQTLRTGDYRTFLERLPGYACECSRQQIQARTRAAYDGFCRERGLPLAPGRTQWRLRSDRPEHDVVLWRKEGLPAYHLVSLRDDLVRGINLIVRGEDLRESTEQQKRMARILGENGKLFLEAEFIFHPLIVDPDGKKLSKSAGSHSLQHELRTKTPLEIFERLSRLAGRPVITSAAEALAKW